MYTFLVNGYIWSVVPVKPHSSKLIDQTGEFRVATTDPKTLCIYLNEDLGGDFLDKVIKHELCHCIIFSYDLARYIHKVVPKKYWIESEEWMCNFISKYNDEIAHLAHNIELYFGR